MAMPVSARRYTADDLADLPEDGNRYEVLDGVLLVTPAPSRGHQEVQAELLFALGPFARSLGLSILAAPTAVRASATTELQPDILVLPRRYAGREDAAWERMSALVLAIEILSPSSRTIDRERKRVAYLANGVAEYWIVDAEARTVEVWRPGSVFGAVVSDELHWQPVQAHAGYRLDVSRVFQDALDG